MEQLTLHATVQPGRFSTHPEHIDSRKVHSIERGVEYLLRKVRFIGPYATRWAEATLEERGIAASRTMQGLLSLCKKHQTDEIERACDVAWRSKAYSYRVVKRLLDNQSAARQQTMDFVDEHPIIRSVSEYGDFVKRSIQGG